MNVATELGKNLAEQIVKTANKSKESLDYDRTYFCNILKTSTETSENITDAEAETLDDLNKGWYYVKINGVFYKLRCDEVEFAVDEPVKVTVPQNNWNRMYIQVAKGGGEGSKDYTITLLNTDWQLINSGYIYSGYCQTVEATWAKKSLNPIVDLKFTYPSLQKDECLNLLDQFSFISRIDTNDGNITVICYEVAPTIDITLNFKVIE